MSIFSELKRRNVFRVAATYVVTAWLLIEIGNTLEETLNLPEWADTFVAFLLIIGFPVVLFFSWAFEITPEGIKREKDIAPDASSRDANAHKLNRALLIIMGIALAYFAADKFLFTSDPVAQTMQSTASVEAPSPATPVVEEIDDTGSEGKQVSGIPEKSIAVLPFVNMSSDPEQEYFSDGLTEELLNLLAGIDELKVAARTSSFFYKDKVNEIPMKEMARQLEVAHILEGSVRKGGDQIRITAQLIKADDGFHLWSETYDRTLDDVFAIQDEIAAAVVDQLKVTLLGEAPHARVIDPESYQLALQGRFLYNRRASGDLPQALELFERAVEIDPDNAIAWAGLAPLYRFMFNPPRWEDALNAATRAVELDPENPEALLRKAQTMFNMGHAEEDYMPVWNRAMELGKNNPLVLSVRAGLLINQGEIERGLEIQKQAIANDPLHLVNIGNMVSNLLFLGRWQDALPYVEKINNISPGSSRGAEFMANIALLRGQPEKSLAILEDLPVKTPDELMLTTDNSEEAWRIMARHDMGDQAEAEKLLANYIAVEKQRNPDIYALNTAPIYAYMGEADRAFEWIDRALDINPDPPLKFFVDVRYAGLLDDPRWQRVRDLYPDFQGWDEVLR